MDSNGSLYLYEAKTCTGGTGCESSPHTNRVQKFDQDGNFLLMFGGEVNLTAVAEREEQEANAEPVTVTAEEENICTAASGDECGPGVQGSGDGEFGTGALMPIDPEGSFIAVGPEGEVFVGSQQRIQVFADDGSFLGEIPLPEIVVRSLAVDGAGNFYVVGADWKGNDPVFGRSAPNVAKLSPTGEPLCTANIEDPRAIAVDGAGRLYVSVGIGLQTSIHRFGPDCSADLSFAFNVGGLGLFDVTTGIATSEACGIDGNVYYSNTPASNSFVRAYYPQPDPSLCPPPKVAPSIGDQWAEFVSAHDAIVKAEINPHFWPTTRYYVQWGTEDCRTNASACSEKTLFPGKLLAAESDVPVKTSGIPLSGLSPDTKYYFRFVAESGGGGPVFGGDPDGGGPEEANWELGINGTFTTYAEPPPSKADCGNQPLRIGASASLPDCRAYELVSPADKEGGDILSLYNTKGDPASLYQAASGGERMTYSSYRSFGKPQSAPYTSQYLATRTGSGWSSEAISPIQEGPSFLDGAFFESSFKGFDEELCNAWVLQLWEPTLTADAVAGYSNLYRRSNCAPETGAFESITRVQPVYEPSLGTTAPLPVTEFLPSFQGSSENGGHVVFRAAGRLVPEAASCSPEEKTENGNQCPRQVYDYQAGQLRLVCILPSGKALTKTCSLGNGKELESTSLHNNVFHAVSRDGSRIVWSDTQSGPGKLFVRVNGEETIEISKKAAWYWAAAVDGSRVIYNVPTSVVKLEGALQEFDIDAATKRTIAGEVTGVLGASDDDRRIYFVSHEVLSSEENHFGAAAVAGANNLYFYEAGVSGGLTFIASLSNADGAASSEVSPIQPDPFSRTSRVAPDGVHALFTSTAPLTGVDNTDAVSGEPDSQVFLYDAGSNTLRCVSCNPAGARPHGHQVELSRKPLPLWASGSIPGWTDQTHPSRVLSADGKHVFFDSSDRLVPADTNGRRDVYEWEQGESQSACDEAGAQVFLKREGGCISLISSGQSSSDSEFLDAGGNGRDVFFRTHSSLVPEDPGLFDIYDAREGGGFPAPPQSPPSCEGEGCQLPPAGASSSAPPSATFEGAGSPSRHRQKQCRKGKVRRKGKCVKKPAAHHRRHKQKNKGGRR